MEANLVHLFSIYICRASIPHSRQHLLAPAASCAILRTFKVQFEITWRLKFSSTAQNHQSTLLVCSQHVDLVDRKLAKYYLSLNFLKVSQMLGNVSFLKFWKHETNNTPNHTLLNASVGVGFQQNSAPKIQYIVDSF